MKHKKLSEYPTRKWSSLVDEDTLNMFPNVPDFDCKIIPAPVAAVYDNVVRVARNIGFDFHEAPDGLELFEAVETLDALDKEACDGS